MQKNYTELEINEIDSIFIQNTDEGPFREDIFFIVTSNTGRSWVIPNSESLGFTRWLEKLPGTHFPHLLESLFCTENRIFPLYRCENRPFLDDSQKEILRKRFTRFIVSHFNIPHTEAVRIRESLFQEYSQPHRTYHNLEHLSHCIWMLDQVQGLDFDINRVNIELAIWYHDFIYAPRARDNEKRSTEVMLQALSPYEDRIDLNQVSRIIQADPLSETLSFEEKVFLDIDYAVLGQRPLDYLSYRQNLALEFLEIPQLFFKFKRKIFLKNVLNRGVFRTKWFRDQYEERAKQNIQKELAHWSYRILPIFTP